VHRGSHPAGEQLTDRSRIQPVGLAPAVALLLAHRRHLSGVDQPHHQLLAIIQVAGERLMVVAGGLDADDHQLGIQLGPRGGDQPLQPGQPGTVGDQPHAVDHDLPEQRAGDHEPGRLGDIDPDQQHPPRIGPTHQLQEPSCPLAPNVATMHHRPTPFCRLLSVTDSSLAGRGSLMSPDISAGGPSGVSAGARRGAGWPGRPGAPPGRDRPRRRRPRASGTCSWG
jgi:hypothetical protein